jgi:hypothetical protein
LTGPPRSRFPAAALAAAAVLAAGACGKAEAPKVDAATERSEANKRAREDAFGAQVKAHDAAKTMQDDLNRKAQENVDSIEKAAK